MKPYGPLVLLMLGLPIVTAGDPSITWDGATASSNLVGVVVVRGANHLFMTAPTGAAAAVSVLDADAGAPVSILCYDNDGTVGPRCTLDVYRFDPLTLTCGPLVATASNTETGLSLVTAYIPVGVIDFASAGQFCAFPGISHATVTAGAAIVTVVRA